MKLYKWKTGPGIYGDEYKFYGGFRCLKQSLNGFSFYPALVRREELGSYSLLYLDDSYMTTDGQEYHKFLLCDDKEYRNGKIVYIKWHLIEPLFGE